MRFAKMLQNKRLAKGLTQKELGQQIGLTTGTYISQMESGEKVPPTETTIKLAEALEMEDIGELVFQGIKERSKVEYAYLIKEVAEGKGRAPSASTLRIEPWPGQTPPGDSFLNTEAQPHHVFVPIADVDDPEAYVVEVMDDTLEGELNRGDMAIVCPSHHLTNGDVALIEIRKGDQTISTKVARVKFRNGEIELSGTKSTPQQVLKAGEFRIRGRIGTKVSSL